MAANTIRVGILGASPDRGWASTAHVPALRALPEYELTAVGTSRADSARKAAELFGAAHAFTDARQLAEHPEVDLVTITVKVPAHVELVRAALDAGKHVYCEWPLTATTEQAEELASVAALRGVHHAIGLQSRYSPAINHAKALIAEGYVGRVTSVNVYSARGKGGGVGIPSWSAYTLDQANGAGLVEVGGGHTLDAVEHLAGRITELSAGLSVQRPEYTIAETGERIDVTSPDQLLLAGTLAGGAALSVHLHDAKVSDARTRVEIAGTEGDLAIVSIEESGGLASSIQIGNLRVLGTRDASGVLRELPVPDRFRTVPGDLPDLAVRNIAELYAQLARDIRTGSRDTADFADGVRVHRLLDAVRRSSVTGTRVTFAG
ncbi:Gfo/Idh/MocA family oxidoreductase [Solihabitans fulvus]|uniref:Gfo/Idh/MocA family oxidoreductase n=1 Tax=Solihabitans fulvus TaxID=1892852 RepID=A0A5B2WE81_9PSEU|nr:Gfo/Idh/MocA family oxidoreductase [Solihabitans fulvus]KAA2248746.1 Gfo/Idh/MocA family oxidoreductase [Solihabitans fulvus]